MNWKEFGLKIFKGAISGVAVVSGGLLATGIPMTQHAIVVALGTLGSAAFHGAWNVLDQSLAGNISK